MSRSEPTPPNRSFVGYLRPHRWSLALGVVLLLVTNGMDKVIPWLFKVAIDGLTAGRLDVVRDYVVGAAAIALLLWAVRTASRVVIFNVGRDIEYELRNELLDRLHHLGPAFFARTSTGDIMSRATNDLAQVRLLAGFGALNVVNATLGYVGAVALMVTLSPELTLWCLAPLPVFALATRAFSRAIFSLSREAQEALASLSGRAQESLAGVRVVRAFAVEDHIEARFEEANRRSYRANMRLAVLRGIMFPSLTALASLGKLILIWRGGMMMLDGRLTPGEFFAFYAYLDQLMWPTMAFGFLLSIVQRGRVSYQRVREVLDTEPDVSDAPGAVAAGREGIIEVRGLSHSFGERQVLDDVSFRVESQGSVAIVGRTGSGKSTLASLLPRLLATAPGSVFLDGVDVTQIQLRSLREAVGYAQQEPFLFSTTIAGNVGLALDDPDAPDAFDRVVRATRQAAVLDEIESMPDGFETIVGERGVQLSGGQKQRIALARALLNEPAVLVLDDPLSAVDAPTERTILAALDRAGEGRTLVLITNRIAAAKRMESIVVLDEGTVVERGTHAELATKDGIYGRLVARQRIEEELAEL